MEDKIIKVEKELGQANIKLITGEIIPAKTLTIYTYYESGRKDCNVEIERPINISGLPEKL